MNTVEDNIIQLQIDKEIKTLFKFYLEILEQLNLPKEQYDNLRKSVLNHGNDTIRNILQFLEFFDFIVNAEKIKSATQRRIIYSKTTTSLPIVI